MNCTNFLLENTENNTPFLLGPKEELNYSELHNKVNALSIFLKKKYGENNNFLLIASNSIFFIVSYLAIMKSGNVVIPLNPLTEDETLLYIKAQANVNLSFITRLENSRIKCDLGEIFNEVDFKNTIEEYKNSTFSIDNSNFNKERLAAIMYTSGSTGKPKGVMISHKNIIANTNSIIEYLKLTKDDTMLVVLPFYYCYGLSLLHTHLRANAKIVLNNNFIFLGSVINNLKKYKCTGFAGVPSHFQILLRKSDTFKNTEFPDLRYVTQAGGRLSNIFIKEFIETFPNIDFFVMYGQTEATARLSYLPPSRLSDKQLSLGKGIPGVELRVVNAEGKDVKTGEVGEIIAKGDNVMMGYFKDEKATKETIIDNYLYTGDLATIDDDGFIFYYSRKKEIIKVGGRRVSPKEIESVILSMPEVVDCTIEAIDDPILGENIKATIVLANNEISLTPEDIKQYCSDKLAIYKIPGIIDISTKLNLSATGKKINK